MATATVTSKGQVTIPAAVRNALHIQAGDRIEFVEVDSGKFEVIVATSDASELKGMIKVNGAVSIEEMNAAIKAKASK